VATGQSADLKALLAQAPRLVTAPALFPAVSSFQPLHARGQCTSPARGSIPPCCHTGFAAITRWQAPTCLPDLPQLFAFWHGF